MGIYLSIFDRALAPTLTPTHLTPPTPLACLCCYIPAAVDLKLGVTVDEKMLTGYDSVVVATGVLPREVSIPNKSTRIKVLSYVDVLRGGAEVGQRVAVIGAGGIGYDMADFLTHSPAAGTGAPLPRVDERAVSEFLKVSNRTSLISHFMKGVHRHHHYYYYYFDRTGASTRTWRAAGLRGARRPPATRRARCTCCSARRAS